MRLIRDIIRGSGDLPGVGPHPGTVVALGFIAMGALAGAQRGGLWGAVGGGLVMALGILPFWVIGCIDRARISDRQGQRLMGYLKGHK